MVTPPLVWFGSYQWYEPNRDEKSENGMAYAGHRPLGALNGPLSDGSDLVRGYGTSTKTDP